MRKVVLLIVCLVSLCSMATAQMWAPEYTVDGDMDGTHYRMRGIAVFGEDDVAAVYGRPGYSTYTLVVYTNAQLSNLDSAYSDSAAAERWINSGVPTDINEADWGWGCVINPDDSGIYATFGRAQCAILSWDTSANSLAKAAQTRLPDSSIKYTSAMDVDSAGNFYVVAYGSNFWDPAGVIGWTTATIAQNADMIQLPPSTDAAWSGTDITDATHASGHNPTPIGSIDCDGDWDIQEGVCAKPDGTVLWITNRGATGTGEWCYRYTPGGPYGWTKDGAFNFVKVASGASVRGIDCSDDGLEIYTCFDDGALPAEIQINDGVTGDFLQLLDVYTPTLGIDGTLYGHNSPYDVEVTSNPYGGPVLAGDHHGKNMWIMHYYSWYIDKWNNGGDLAFPGVQDWTLY